MDEQECKTVAFKRNHMPRMLSQRLLSVLQLTRMALVFTAISDSLSELLLLSQRHHTSPDLIQILLVAIISGGLYGFGMSLNDIIDRRRDQQLAAHRPLPSGRIGVTTAHVICAFCLLSALLAGGYYAQMSRHGTVSVLLLLWTAFLITMYDYVGKYLVWLGLVTLGAIRFFHALIPAPEIPVVWHPLLLLNHVAILSAVCYRLEDKRPRLRRSHWWSFFGALIFSDVLCLIAVWWWFMYDWDLKNVIPALRIRFELLVPLAAVAAFIVLALLLRWRQSDPRQAGQSIMLYGLLWLIVYDASFVAAYVSWEDAGLLLLLLPAAYISVQLMRWWSKVISLSQKPTFQRAR
jgi:4-hydroxybenzoate polyprenyltransferase